MTTDSRISTAIDSFTAVMAVTLPRDEGYSGAFRLNPSFDLSAADFSSFA